MGLPASCQQPDPRSLALHVRNSEASTVYLGIVLWRLAALGIR